MAPELLQEPVRKINEKVDIWAVGVMTHFLLTGQYPFRGEDFEEVRENILAYRLELEEDLLSPIAKSFIQKCLARKACDR